MIPIIVMSSGAGTNFDAIATSIEKGKLDAKIMSVISDQENALVFAKAKQKGIPTHFVDFKKSPIESCLQIFSNEKPVFLVLAGFMRILPKKILEYFKSSRGYYRVTNIHPSLLPSFQGMDAYQKAFHYGVKYTGVTVHLVDEVLDHGPVCAQMPFDISESNSEAEVIAQGLKVEHALYSDTLAWILPEKFKISKRDKERICVFKS